MKANSMKAKPMLLDVRSCCLQKAVIQKLVPFVIKEEEGLESCHSRSDPDLRVSLWWTWDTGEQIAWQCDLGVTYCCVLVPRKTACHNTCPVT